MKQEELYTGFEQGPIRPPSEAESLLIRVSRNCPWNRCTFCRVYKGTRFSLRPVEHVLRDIDIVHDHVQAILKTRGDRDRLMELVRNESMDPQALQAARHFVAGGMQSIFLQDGNSLVLKPDDLVRILKHITSAFPDVRRITSYARSHTIARISDTDLARIAGAGLNRMHIGMESGADAVLRRVKKGVDKETQIRAGQKIKKTGMELSEYFMPGLGGRDLSRENALETADALNRINPDFIRLRTLALPDGSPLALEHAAGKFQKLGEVETAQELLLFLETLDGITSTVVSDHVLNLFPQVRGTLPGDKKAMTAPIREFLALSPREQLLFCIGRRAVVERTCADLGACEENMDSIVDSIIKRFI
jgi:hypothetical protein